MKENWSVPDGSVEGTDYGDLDIKMLQELKKVVRLRDVLVRKLLVPLGKSPQEETVLPESRS